jgi:hypothetical protein
MFVRKHERLSKCSDALNRVEEEGYYYKYKETEGDEYD